MTRVPVAVLGLTTWMMLRPLLALSRAAAGVQAGDRTARLVPSGGGELRRLAVAFNRMLDRLVQPAAKQYRVGTEGIKQAIQAMAESARATALTAREMAVAAAEQGVASSVAAAGAEARKP